MIKHFNADGSVKQAWPDGLSAGPVIRGGKTLHQVYGSNFVLAEVELGEGEQIGEQFLQPIAEQAAPIAPPTPQPVAPPAIEQPATPPIVQEPAAPEPNAPAAAPQS